MPETDNKPKIGRVHSALSERRLVIVSNRLPFSVSIENGTLSFNESAGGLVTGLSGGRELGSGAGSSAPQTGVVHVRGSGLRGTVGSVSRSGGDEEGVDLRV